MCHLQSKQPENLLRSFIPSHVKELLRNLAIIIVLQGNFNESLAMFLCNGGKGHSGEFVYIRDDREVSASVEYFSLCEVQIFGMEGKSLPLSLSLA